MQQLAYHFFDVSSVCVIFPFRFLQKETQSNRQALDIRIAQRELKTAEEEKDRFREMYKKLRLASHDDQSEKDGLKDKIASLQTKCDQLQRNVDAATAKGVADLAEKEVSQAHEYFLTFRTTRCRYHVRSKNESNPVMVRRLKLFI